MKAIVISIALFLTFILSGCTGQIEKPVQIDKIEGAPEIPTNLQTLVFDSEVELSWSVNNRDAIARFFIYRGDISDVPPVLIDSTTEQHFTDRRLRNNLSYVYRVSSLGTNGLESKFSQPATATPGLYGIVINDGQKYTLNRSVSIASTANPGTRHLLLTADTLAPATWYSFAASKSFELPSGDGVKTVFAKFRDIEGNETSRFVYDDIILDTRAVISSISENSAGRILTAGDILRLILDAEEMEGQASVEIPSVGTVKLYDDGTVPADVPNDGIYEVDYVIPEGVDLENGVVKGKFTDAAGNRAEDKSASTFVNIANPPHSSVLSAFVASESEIELAWTKSDAADFAAYSVFRGENNQVDTTAILVVNQITVSVTSFRATELEPATEYYFVLYTTDQTGLRARSNVVKARTRDNEAPEPVKLFISDQDTTSITLGWTSSKDDDFESYLIYRSPSIPVVQDENLKGVVITKSQISFSDNDIKKGEQFYYVVVVVDKYGLTAASNEVRGPNP